MKYQQPVISPFKKRATHGPAKMCGVRALYLTALSMALSIAPPNVACAQAITAHIGVGVQPVSLAVNQATNKIYAANYGSNTVSVIDGATNATTTVPVGPNPSNLAVNSVTNKIYVANQTAYQSPNSAGLMVIDGLTNIATPIQIGKVQPVWVAVNSVTNKIYVSDTAGSVLVIDGATNKVTTLPGVGSGLGAIKVNSVTNKVYIVDWLNNVLSSFWTARPTKQRLLQSPVNCLASPT